MQKKLLYYYKNRYNLADKNSGAAADKDFVAAAPESWWVYDTEN